MLGTFLLLLSCSPAPLGEACDIDGCLLSEASSEASAVLLQATVEYSGSLTGVDIAGEVPRAPDDFVKEAMPASGAHGDATATAVVTAVKTATDATGATNASDTQERTSAMNTPRAGAQKVAADTLSVIVPEHAGHEPPDARAAAPVAGFGYPTMFTALLGRPAAAKLPDLLSQAEWLQLRLVGVLATVAIVVALVSQRQLRLNDGVCKRGHRLQPSSCAYHGACGHCGHWIGAGQSVSVCAPCSFAACAKCMSAGDVLRHCKRIQQPSSGGVSSWEGSGGNQGAKHYERASLVPARR